MAGGQSPPARARVSEVETEYFRMSLDHDSGTMTGVVRKGREQGRRAWRSSISLICWRSGARSRAEDPASAKPARGLSRPFPRRIGGMPAEAPGEAGPKASAGMTVEEAYSILGLKAGGEPPPRSRTPTGA